MPNGEERDREREREKKVTNAKMKNSKPSNGTELCVTLVTAMACYDKFLIFYMGIV